MSGDEEPTATKAPKRKSHHPIRENIEVVVFAIVMALVLKVFAVEAYQIPTGSMQPTLMGTTLVDPETRQQNGGLHDRVLVDKVSYLFRDPLRWEVVVFRYPLLTHNNYVKRLVGMPGEQLLIENGDLWARPLGSDEDFSILRKPWKVQKHLWKKALPRPGDDAENWHGWRPTGTLELDADGNYHLQSNAHIELPRPVRDEYAHGYPEEIAFRIPNFGGHGSNVVCDLRVRFSVIPDGPRGHFQSFVDCGPFENRLLIEPDGRYRVELPDGHVIEERLEMTQGEPVEVDFAFWDQSVRLRLRTGAGERLHERALELGSRAVVRNGISFESRAGGWLVTPPTVWRDIHYLQPRQNAAGLFDIEEGHYFMLGDNTQSSLDSRDWSAEVIELEQPGGGTRTLVGDRMDGGMDPMFENPRWDRERQHMTFRDVHGNLTVLAREEVRAAVTSIEPRPLVPREYVLGRALAVFLPVPPFAPVVRIGLVH